MTRTALVLFGAGVLAACGGGGSPPPRPAEIPIGDFKAEGPGPGAGDATAGTSSPSASSTSTSTASATPPGTSTGASSTTTTSSAAPATTNDAAGGSEASAGAAPPAVAAKLDAKNGFAGAQLGASVKSFRGLKATEKNGDRATYHATAGKPSYAGAALKDVTYTFMKGKLAMIFFSVKAANDCKTVREGLERELGPAQKSTTTPSEAWVWKGDKVGMRFAIGQNFCGGSVVSKDLSDPAAWSALEP